MGRRFTFVDLFAGIGGFRIALENVGGECIASSEIDSDAIHVYKKNWIYDPAKHNLGDITKIEKLPSCDLIVGGVPCQSWSIAGKNKGSQDPRGKLWNEVIRLVKRNKPKAFIFENVKGLSDPRHKNSLSFLIDSFSCANYRVQFKVLNSYDFGVPQNRDRIFIVGIRNDLINADFSWPQPVNKHTHLYNILDIEKPIKKYQQTFHIERDSFGNRVSVGFNKLTPVGKKNPFFVLTDIRNGSTSIHSWEIIKTTKRQKEICLIMMKNRRKSVYGKCDGNPISFKDLKELIPNLKIKELNNLISLNILKRDRSGKFEFVNRRISGGISGVYRIYLPESTFFSTLTATGNKDMIATTGIKSKNYREGFIKEILLKRKYRAISSKEMVIIQGFPLDFITHEKESKNTKLFGNAVSVPVIEAIAKSLIRTGCFKNINLKKNYNEVVLAS